MGKEILYGENIPNLLSEIAETNPLSIGLLIGNCTAQRDLVVHACPCPSQDDEEEDDDKPSEKKKKDLVLTDLLDVVWVAQHAKQVTRMLPGGVDVLGLYIISPSQPKCHKELKEALSGVFKTLAKYQTLSPVSQEKERPILHLQPSSNKYTCKTFDITDSKGPGAGKTVEWKKAPSPLSWRQLEAQLGLDHRLTVPARQSRASLLRQLETSLEPLMAALLAGPALIQGSLLPPDSPLPSGPLQATLLLLEDIPEVSKENSQEVQVVESSAEMQIKGTVQGRAFVRPQATVGEAIQALKQDIFRSLLVRLEIQCGDLLAIDEEHHDPEVIHELPHRAHAPLPHSGGLTVCDYLFHGDSPSDSIQVFHDLLYISVPETDICIAPLENSPNVQTLLQQPEEDKLSAHPREWNLVPLLGASVVGVVASTLYLLYSSHS